MPAVLEKLRNHAASARAFALSWRGLRDAAVVVVIGTAVFIFERTHGLFDGAYELAGHYVSHQAIDLIAAAIVFASSLLVYIWRRAQDLKSEIHKRQNAESIAGALAARLTTVFNNIPQGILMFDSSARLVVCNDYYVTMYNLSSEAVKPGKTLLEIVQHRGTLGLLTTDAETHTAEVLARIALKKIVRRVVVTLDKREIAVTDYPMADGGWVSIHEDRTELHRREESFRLLFDNNPVAMWLFDRDSLQFVAVNDAAIACYGYSREQFLQMKIMQMRVEDDVIAETKIRSLPEIQNQHEIGLHKRANGETFSVAICSRVMDYEGRKVRLTAITDITAQKMAEDDLHRTKMFLNAVIENVPMPIVVKTVTDGRFTLINKASEELHGYRRETTIGKTLSETFPKETADTIAQQDAEFLRLNRPTIVQHHKVRTHKGERQVAVKKVTIPGADGKPEYIVTLIDDVTERLEAERRIAHMALSDPLTDLPNRAAFNEHLDATLELAAKQRQSFAVLCMDLDGFKGVNDIYGHAVGDRLLCQVADRLRAVADGIFVARLGGDEFTMIAANGGKKSIIRLIDRLLAALAEDFEIEGHSLPQALSIGVAMYPEDGEDANTLLNNADAALYRAKADGTGSVRYFKAEIAARRRERSVLQTDLGIAIQRDELSLHYQPQLKISGEVTGFEALARWTCIKRGMVLPSYFIPLAEESSLILLLGEWVMRAACREAASWPKPLNISVNVSPVQFRHGDLPRMVHTILLETGLAPNRLEIEITEGVLIDDFSRALSILRRIKSLGVRIALDDFGKGYSSLSYLHAFPFDKIKIDRSFIADLDHNQQSKAIVHAVIGLGHNLKIPILAEGVETPLQHALLAKEGCNEVQGYLTGRPLVIAQYAEIVGRTAPVQSHSQPQNKVIAEKPAQEDSAEVPSEAKTG